jgi:hypothetical protein
MSNQVLAGSYIPEDNADAEALQHIWWTYSQEANKFDQRRLSHLHKNLDVRLIFVRTTSTFTSSERRQVNKSASLVYFQQFSRHS